MIRSRGALALAVTVLLGASTQLAAQTAPAPAAADGKAQGTGATTPVKKLAEWSELKPTDRERTMALFGQLKKDAPEVRAAARDALSTLGDGTAPVLFQMVSDREEKTNGELFAVFDQLLGPQHAALMARELKKNKIALRQYMALRLCKFVDPDMRPVLQAATKDKDETVVFHAQLGLAALHDTAALAVVLENTRTAWEEHRALIASVLPAARCEACGRTVAELIAKATPPVQAAGLRLLRYVATDAQRVIVRNYLTAEDHGVKKEAVNAMRVLSGMEPIENLSAFQSIEMAKEWLNK